MIFTTTACPNFEIRWQIAECYIVIANASWILQYIMLAIHLNEPQEAQKKKKKKTYE